MVELVIPRGLATGILFPNNRRVSKSTVQKASHCAWQIHYHIVFPVKYRKALLADDVVEIITEVTRGLAERYDMEFERLGCDRIISICCVPLIRRLLQGKLFECSRVSRRANYFGGNRH